MAKVSFACLESLEGLDLSLNEDQVETQMQDLNDTVQEIQDINIDTATVIASTTALDEINVAAGEMGEEVDPVALEALYVALNYHGSILNNIYQRQIVPILGNGVGLETYDRIKTDDESVLDSFVQVFELARKAFRDAMTSVYQLADFFLKTTKKLRQELSDVANKPVVDQIRINNCRTLSYKNKVDIKSIIQGSNEMLKVVDHVTGDYSKAIFDHFNTTLIEHNKAIKELGIIDYSEKATAKVLGEKVQSEFKERTQASFKKAVGKLPNETEVNGGYVFGFTSIDITQRPKFFERINSTVQTSQMIKTPSKAEINEMLDIVEGISKIVHSRKTWAFINSFKMEFGLLKAQFNMPSEEKSRNLFARFVAYHNNLYISRYNIHFYTIPVSHTAHHAFVLSRALLSVCKKSVAAYAPK